MFTHSECGLRNSAVVVLIDLQGPNSSEVLFVDHAQDQDGDYVPAHLRTEPQDGMTYYANIDSLFIFEWYLFLIC